MKTITTFFCLMSLLAATSVHAQQSHEAEAVLQELTRSGILKRYHTYRLETEQKVAMFKANQHQHSPEQINAMKASYRETSQAFQHFIYVIRTDLLDSKTRRYIRKHIEAYVEAKLEELDGVYEEFYMNKFYQAFQQNTAAHTASQRVRPPSLPMPTAVNMMTPIIDATAQVLDFLDSGKEQALASFKELMDRQWIRPNEFTEWEEIE